MSYQLGTNWSVFSDKIANVLGPIIGFEVLTAFFLEASFLGVMLFGFGRVSKKMHFVATCIVAIGTLISAFWILSANSWMQTPSGFEIMPDGRFAPTNWLQTIFNPSFPYRFVHMIMAAYLTAAFVVGGVAAFYLLKKRHMAHARVMLYMSIFMAAIVAPLQLIAGHRHGENTMEYQPAKIAAMEGNWDHSNNAPLYLFGWPNQETQTTDYGIAIPGGASFVLTGDVNGAIPTLKSFKKEDLPKVFLVFWSFRIMVALGIMMILIGFTSIIYCLRRKFFENRFMLIWWTMMIPSGFIALLAGWFVTEMGRQPYTVYGLLRTTESLTPAVLGPQVAWSLLSFVVMYTLVFGAGVYYITKLIRKGIARD